MKRILFIFIDGIGLGVNSDKNPFSLLHLPGFLALADNQPWTGDATPYLERDAMFIGIDACLGVEGLPQSGTGQASLFSGVNCAKLAGRHYGPFPHSTSIPTLSEHNIFLRVTQNGSKAAFANAYPPIFFERVRQRNRWSVTTRCCLLANLPIRTIDDLKSDRAIAADITGSGLKSRLSIDVEPRTPETAADILIRLATRNAFTAFEYYLTDKSGHNQSFSEAKMSLKLLDRFLTVLIEQARRKDITLVVTSDHGNLEDLGSKTHTFNPVPLAVCGPGASYFHQAESLIDVTPAIMRFLTA